MTGRQRDAATSGQASGIGVEKNLLWLPIGTLARGRGRRTLVVSCEDSYTDGTGGEISWRWTCAGDARLGLPGEFEQDAFMALHEMLQGRGGLDEGWGLEFSNYELLRAMGRGTDDKHYRMVRPALKRLAGVRFSSERSFFDAQGGRVLAEKDFGLCALERVEVAGRGGRVRENNRIVFEEPFVRSYHAGYLERLDMEFYKSLRLPTSKRLFGMAGERCDEGGAWRIGLHTLRDAMPLGHYEHASHIWAALKRPISELLGRGFFAAAERETSADGRQGAVVFRLAKGFGARRRAEELRTSPATRAAVELLEAVGLVGAAEGLVAEHGTKRCERMARETLKAVADGADIKNMAGLCRWNLNTNERFVLPKNARPGPAAPGLSGRKEAEKKRRTEGYEWLFEEGG